MNIGKILKVQKKYAKEYSEYCSEKNLNLYFMLSIAIAVMEIGIIGYQYLRLGDLLFSIKYFHVYMAALVLSIVFTLLFGMYKSGKVKLMRSFIDIMFLLSFTILSAAIGTLEASYGSSINVIFISWVIFLATMLNLRWSIVVALITAAVAVMVIMLMFFLGGEIDKQAYVLNYIFIGFVNIALSLAFCNAKVETFNQKMEIEEVNRRLHEKNQMLEFLNKNLEVTATTDAVTNVQNRMSFNKIFSASYQLAVAKSTSVSVIMIDVDHFKGYNDTFGHVQGDWCLKEIAGLIKNSLKRSQDAVFRYGGEEFIVLLTDTDIVGTKSIAKRIVKNIASAKIPSVTKNTFVTISAGLHCIVPDQLSSAENLIECADEALYYVKQHGRNNIVAYQDIEDEE